MKAVGARLPRYDGSATSPAGRSTSTTSASADLWVKALRSPHHHAAITKLDTAKAEATDGRSRDDHRRRRPAERLRPPRRARRAGDEPLLADGEVRYKGQPIAAVAAESEEAARRPSRRSRSPSRSGRPLFDIRIALDPEAPQIHQWGNVYPHYGPYNHRRVRKGDIDWAFDKADAIVEGVYRPQAIEQMPMETQVALAVPEASGR